MRIFGKQAQPEVTLTTSPGDDSESFLHAQMFRVKTGEEEKTVSLSGLLADFLQSVLRSSADSVRQGKQTQLWLLGLLSIMYGLTFILGLTAFAVAIFRGVSAKTGTEVAIASLFGGLSVAIFFAFFILRPTAGIERASISNLWMSLLTNTYWTRLAFSLQAPSAPDTSADRDHRLEDSAKDALTHLKTLLDVASGIEKQYLQTAEREADRSAASATAITLASPQSPAELDIAEGTTLSDIKVDTTPEGQGLTWTIEGDDKGKLAQVQPGQFDYTRGAGAQDKVTLRFALASDDGASVMLEVDKPNEPINITAPTTAPQLAATEGTVLSGIKIATDPPGQAITWTIEGDVGGELAQVLPGEFKYTRGPNPDDKVSLKFALVADGSHSASLDVGTSADA